MSWACVRPPGAGLGVGVGGMVGAGVNVTPGTMVTGTTVPVTTIPVAATPLPLTVAVGVGSGEPDTSCEAAPPQAAPRASASTSAMARIPL